MKAIPLLLLLPLILVLGGCATSGDSNSSSTSDNPGDQPPGERRDGLGIMPGGAGFKQSF